MSSPSAKQIEAHYQLARARYADCGVDVDRALQTLAQVSISLHCWQGDDVRGFEVSDQAIGGGLAVTGNYPGRARTPGELRMDLAKVFQLVPGNHRLNLHAMYGDFGGKTVDRDEVEVEHFQEWMAWAPDYVVGLDFNPTYFAHEKANDGFTLAHWDKAIQRFWIEHGQRCRQIGCEMGRQLGSPCVTNFWIPDGYKDNPADRDTPRHRLLEALDEVFRMPYEPRYLLDAVECKLFGIGSESYVVGSHEFYLGYALTRGKMLCLDAGHFHPTETISDKISAVLCYLDRILLHVSRGVRWDSDHVVILSDELLAIAQEIVRGKFIDRVRIGLDFFDASINRLSAWVIGSRNVLKALLFALLEPWPALCQAELAGDFTRRLALLEEIKTLPFGAVWDFHCLRQGVPVGMAWMSEIEAYEASELARR